MLTLLLTLTAHATSPLVLHGDDVPDNEAGTRAAVVDGQTASTMSWAAYQASRPATIVGDSTLERCRGAESTVTKVQEHLRKAQNSLDYMENESALGHLRAAERATVCATDRVAAETLAKTQFLNGIIMFNEGDKEKARTAWRQAFVVAPDLEWDSNFEPSGQPIFEDVRDNMQYEAKAELRVLPHPQGKAILNGAPVDTTVEAMGGTHLLQYTDTKTHTMWLNLAAGDTPAGVVPSLFSSDLTGLISTEDGRKALNESLGLIEPNRTIMVLTPKTSWKSTNGGAWQEIAKTSRRTASASGSKTVIWSVAAGLGVSSLGSLIAAGSSHGKFQDRSTPESELEGLRSRTNAAYFASIGLGTGAAVMVGLGLVP